MLTFTYMNDPPLSVFKMAVLQAWWPIPGMPGLRRLKWEGQELESHPGYTVRLCLKNKFFKKCL